jgi:endoglucanase
MDRVSMRLRRCLTAVFAMSLAAGCGGAAAEPRGNVWIDVPVDGLRVGLGQAVQVEGHVAGTAGSIQVQILVDGANLGTVEAAVPEGGVAPFSFAWTPKDSGEHILSVAATAADGSEAASDSARVIVLMPATPTWPPTPPPTHTPTPTIPPGAEVEFWAEPAEIAAGMCSRLRWRVRDASRVRLGHTDVAAEGSFETCLCDDEAYTLTVTNLDGTEQERRVTIQVSGKCVTPTPVPDEAAPPAPSLSSPSNGASVGCVGSVNLDWNGVDDPSGIAEYRLEVQRHSGDNNWQDAPGSPWTGIGSTSRSISVQCGWTYRWRVRAVDGAGNVGAWSSRFTFIVPLT